MSITSFLWGTSQFDEAVEKATSELLPSGSEDIELNLEICDQIRSKNVTAKDAVKTLKSRVNHKNPNVQLLALALIDTCIKNGGDAFLVEITSREFIDNAVSILKQPAVNLDVKNKILFYLQNWALSLEGKATMGYLGTVYKTLQREGFQFPPRDLAAVNSAMTETQTAPEWIDSDVCLRCRTPFSFTNRKHHCRNCGQVFDQQCSSKTKPLPHFGIPQEVRVCDGCYISLNKGKSEKSLGVGSHAVSSRSSQHRRKSAEYDPDLQRALELSLAESSRYPSSWSSSEPPLVDRFTRPQSTVNEDPELKAAIEASLRESQAPRPSAPPTFAEDDRPQDTLYRSSQYLPPERPAFTLPNYDLHPLETDSVLSFNQVVEDAQSQGGLGGRHNHNVNELYEKATRVRPKLAMSLDDADRKQQMLLEMNSKITEATKLYDQYLTQQISHTNWRRQAHVSSPQQAGSILPASETRNRWEVPALPNQTGISTTNTQYDSQPFIFGARSGPQQMPVSVPSLNHYAQSPIQVQESIPQSPTRASNFVHSNPNFQPPNLHRNQPMPPISLPRLPAPVTVTSVAPALVPSSPPSLLDSNSHTSHSVHAPSAQQTASVPSRQPHVPIAQTMPIVANGLGAPPSRTTSTAQPYTPPSWTTSSTMPVFPTVPISEPQSFVSYPHTLAESEQRERKEALLIDL